MKAIFNFREIDPTKPQFLANNRAFCYGDGLFETIVTGPNRIDLIHFHLDRLMKGADALKLQLPNELTGNYLKSSISYLAQTNQLEGNIRTKLIVWRKSGGLYAPEMDQVDFYLECKSAKKPFYHHSGEIGISRKYFNTFSPYSFAKRINALQYVLAGHEMTEKGWDETILLDSRGHLSETHIGNLIWIKDGIFHTPPIQTGCIDGVMRKAFINACNDLGMTINETKSEPELLKDATSILSINASGISSFKLLESKLLSDSESLVGPIIKRLQQP